MTGIFINYRRDDAPGVAGRLYDHLIRSFPRRDLFMDVDAIKPGLDFVKQLDNQVSHCDVLLALIGPKWLSEENERSKRLHSDRDYVRIEIAAALKRDIPVIPVLIDGAAMPDEDDLPENLKSLARRHALELRHTRFADDADVIAAALKDYLPGQKKKKLMWGGVVAACLLGAAGLGTALYLWSGPGSNVTPATPTVTQPTAVTPTKPAIETAQPANPQSYADEMRQKLLDAQRQMAEAKARADAAKARVPATSSLTPTTTTQVNVQGLQVALGDTRDRVQSAYPTAKTTPNREGQPPFLNSSADGVMFFFTADGKLENIRMNAPFTGSVQGIRVGDSLDEVLKIMGAPVKPPWDFGDDKAYLYNTDQATIRYDIDPSDRVHTIFYFTR
jgi:TIR domain